MSKRESVLARPQPRAPAPPSQPGPAFVRRRERELGSHVAPFGPIRVAAARDEQRADRAAAAVAAQQRPDHRDLDGHTAPRPGVVLPSVAARLQGLSGGTELPEPLKASIAPGFGFSFDRIRIHADGEAASLAHVLGARAFTLGRDIVFGAGEYVPQTAGGRQLIAHEIAHVAQQRTSSTPVLQLASVRTYSDALPEHDPSRLTDAEIEATEEYKGLMALGSPAAGAGFFPPLGPVAPVAPVAPVTRPRPEEARLTVRLILRAMREGRQMVSGGYVWRQDVLDAELVLWLGVARSRLETTATAEATVGTEHWVGSNANEVLKPDQAKSDFTKWMLGGGTTPDPATGKLNCYEMVLFSAYRAGHLDETRMRNIYTASRQAMFPNGPKGPRDDMAFPRTLERLLRSSNEQIYDPANPKTPRPLRGDLVIFKEAANHVALATGSVTAAGVGIVSHWPPPDGSHKVKITTIEALLSEPSMRGITVAKFWSPIW